MSDLQIINTGDGSHSIYHPALNETYHSHHGALQESQHVFIQEGIAHWRNQYQLSHISVLEVGFGTGLNALLALIWSNLHQVTIDYVTLEPYPIPANFVDKLNYCQVLMEEKLMGTFKQMHHQPWQDTVKISTNFLLTKHRVRLEEFQPTRNPEVVFFDAFAPNKQAEIWSITNLEKLYHSLEFNGILVTYCAQGQFKRNLKQAGFEVNTLAGPPGKKEMVRAQKTYA